MDKQLARLEMQGVEDAREAWEWAAAVLALTLIPIWGLFLGC